GVLQGAREKKLAPLRREIFLLANPIHVAMTIRSVANQDRASESAIAKRKFLVDAKRSIFVADDIRARSFFGEIAGRENVHSHDLELCGGDCPFVTWAFVARNGGGQNFPLLDERGNQAVNDAFVLDALSYGKNVGMRCFHKVVDDNAAVDLK